MEQVAAKRQRRRRSGVTVKHTFRVIHGQKLKTARISPLKAIRWFCVECMQSLYEPANCTDTRCALLPFRMGKHPHLYAAEVQSPYDVPDGLEDDDPEIQG